MDSTECSFCMILYFCTLQNPAVKLVDHVLAFVIGKNLQNTICYQFKLDLSAIRDSFTSSTLPHFFIFKIAFSVLLYP